MVEGFTISALQGGGVSGLGQGLKGLVVRENGVDSYHYVYSDHLGSILTVTTSSGNVEFEQNFDAWGRRRNASTWNYDGVVAAPDWLYRGYTGHEMLDAFVLINMNGRIYDPVVGRVLSPDNFVSDPFSTQGFNRYSYGMNNPLKYTDPDGNTPLLGAIIGGLGYVLSVAFSDGGFKNWDWGQFAFSAASGALTAGFAEGIGSAATDLAKAGVSRSLVSAYQLGAHGIVGGVSVLSQGGNFGVGFLTSAVGSAVGSATEGLGGAVQIGSSALLGGLVTAWDGGDFWKGAAQAGIVAAFNHFLHPLFQDPPRKRVVQGNRNLSDPKKYPGISIYQNDDKSDMSAVTLPGFGIYIGGGYQGSQLAMVMQHEYGHYLDYSFSSDIHFPIPIANFYLEIGLPSIFNAATGIGGPHSTYWTEIRANQWAKTWFGSNLHPDFLKYYPTK